MANTTHVTLRLNKEKGQQRLREGKKNTKQILVDDDIDAKGDKINKGLLRGNAYEEDTSVAMGAHAEGEQKQIDGNGKARSGYN